MNNLAASWIRTIVPVVVGTLLGYLGMKATDAPEVEALLFETVTLAFTGLYYLAVRILEEHISPKFGWLLGYAKKPEYKG